MWKFKGISSEDMDIVASELDFTAKAPQRINQVNVDGKNESQYTSLGYEEVDIDVFLQLLDPSRESEVYAWLNGEDLLEYAGKISKAYFYGSFQLTRDATIKTGKVRFMRSPFWHKANEEFTIITTSVVNIGTEPAQPLLRFEKGTTETFDITIGGVRFQYSFGSDTFVEIECGTGEVKYDGLFRFSQIMIGFDLPILPVGTSSIVLHSGDPVIKIKQKDRWL